MMRVLVIGANGKTGTLVTQKLLNSEHEPIAMIRNSNHKNKFDAMGVETRIADLEFPIDHALNQCDAVIFAAGSGSKTGKDKTVLVDHIGAIRSIVGAQVQGINRYVMLSSIHADTNSTSPISHYLRAKAHADNYLRESNLNYTIVCPGALTDDPGTDRIALSFDLAPQSPFSTSRSNLAKVLVSCLDVEASFQSSFSVCEGDTEITTALNSQLN